MSCRYCSDRRTESSRIVWFGVCFLVSEYFIPFLSFLGIGSLEYILLIGHQGGAFFYLKKMIKFGMHSTNLQFIYFICECDSNHVVSCGDSDPIRIH
jgi:hypothetical protein